MVFINSPSHSQHSERLIQSIDLALRDLLHTGDDPLALALYLWIVREHKLSLIHGDDLARWGTAWIYQVLVEGKVTRRKDEQITSAMFAYAALAKTEGLSTLEGDFREMLSNCFSTFKSESCFSFCNGQQRARWTIHEPTTRINCTCFTRFAEKHRGRHMVSLSAFGFGIVLEVLAWLLVALALVPSFDAARRYWLFHEYNAMTSHSALLYLLYVLLATLLLFVTPVFTWTWGSLLLRSKAESDRQIAVVVGRRLFKVFCIWLTLIVLVVIINFVTGLFQPAFQHAVGG